jgi:2-dehydropantoate 2-reductase
METTDEKDIYVDVLLDVPKYVRGTGMSTEIIVPEQSGKDVRERRILVYGAGPVGSQIAYRFQDASLDVTVLSRDQRLEYIKRYGIMLESFEGSSKSSRKVKVIERLTPLDQYDLVIVALGKNYYPGVLPFLVANIYTPNILFLGNNAAGPTEIFNLIERERVLLGFPMMSGTIRGRVIQYADGFKPSITVGEFDGGESERVEWIKELLEFAGFDVEVCSKMEVWLKYHAAVILAVAASYLRVEGDFNRLSKDKEGLTLMFKAMREGFSALKELGYPMIPERLKRFERVPLSLVTLYAGRMLKNKEIEYIFAHSDAMQSELRMLNRDFIEILRSTSIPTPAYNELSEYLHK